MEFRWYILNVVSGQEYKIAREIENIISVNKDVSSYIQQVFVPCKQVIRIKRGKKIQETQKLFPGYVFLKANLNSDVYSIVTSIPKVANFLGAKNYPKPISEDKMKEIVLVASSESEDITINNSFEVGDLVKVIDGSFESFTGSVDEVYDDKKRLKVSILIFGRTTSIEVSFDQIEKVTN